MKTALFLSLGFLATACGGETTADPQTPGDAIKADDPTKPGDPGKPGDPAAQDPKVDLAKKFARPVPYQDPKELLEPKDAKPLVQKQTEFAKDFPGLKITVRKPGAADAKAIPYDHLGRFHFVTTLSNGREVENTKKPATPGEKPRPQGFLVRVRKNLKGLALATVGMKVGEVRSIVIPAELAYGKEGDYMRGILENATLTVRAELVEILGPMIKVYQEGKGPAIKDKEVGHYHYTGILAKDGEKFDSSRDEGKPPFPAPMQWPGPTVEGWYLGTIGMKVGERRWIYLPSDYGYGPAGNQPQIGPNEDLIFELELLQIEPAGSANPQVPNPDDINPIQLPGGRLPGR